MAEAEAGASTKKAAAASAGALLTSLLVNPLDVAKVRLQAQLAAAPSPAAPAADLCRCQARCACANRAVTRPVEGVKARSGSRALVRRASSACLAQAQAPLRSTRQALAHIARSEGAAGLFAGLAPAMLIAVPSTVLYYVSYDRLLLEGRRRAPEAEPALPLLAGASARVVAAALTSPLELVRTRMQGGRGAPSVAATARQAVRRGGPQALFAGLGATLARDVPFSAIYWTSYEALQRATTSSELELSRPQRAFVCGALSGAAAAAATTPFDLVKTLQQAQGDARAGPALLRQVVAARGLSGAFTGLGARLARVAPSCAIMISSYELGKQKLGL